LIINQSRYKTNLDTMSTFLWDFLWMFETDFMCI